jgi:glycine dehydrogenase subunit 2
MMAEAKKRGFTLAIDHRRASHEFIITLKNEARDYHVSAMDFAKRLLDLGYHAPTTYFPLLVPECLLIEPTESEAKEALDGFMDALEQIKMEAETNPDLLHAAPQTLPVKRLDEVKAAKQLDLAFEKQ